MFAKTAPITVANSASKNQLHRFNELIIRVNLLAMYFYVGWQKSNQCV